MNSIRASLVFEPILGSVGPLRVRVATMQQIESRFRQAPGLFVGTAISSRSHREMESFRRARVVRIILGPIDGGLTEEIRRGAERLKHCELACRECLRRPQEFWRRDWLRFG